VDVGETESFEPACGSAYSPAGSTSIRCAPVAELPQLGQIDPGDHQPALPVRRTAARTMSSGDVPVSPTGVL